MNNLAPAIDVGVLVMAVAFHAQAVAANVALDIRKDLVTRTMLFHDTRLCAHFKISLKVNVDMHAAIRRIVPASTFTTDAAVLAMKLCTLVILALAYIEDHFAIEVEFSHELFVASFSTLDQCFNLSTVYFVHYHFFAVADVCFGHRVVETFKVRVAESSASCCTCAFIAGWGRSRAWGRRRSRAWGRRRSRTWGRSRAWHWAVVLFQFLFVRLEAFVIACAFFVAIIAAPFVAFLGFVR